MNVKAGPDRDTAKQWLEAVIETAQAGLDSARLRFSEAQEEVTRMEGELRNAKGLYEAHFQPRPESASDAPAATRTPFHESIPDAVEAVLREAGRTLHGQDILRALERHGRPITSKSAMSSLVSALIRHPGRFKKMGRNRWRLQQQESLSTKEP